MLRQLPIVFNQTDYLQRLGIGNSSIAEVGCYNCSMSTLAFACGKQITPVILNNDYIRENLYDNGNLMRDDNLTKIFPDIIFQQAYHYETIPADLNQLKTLMADPANWVILEIDLGNNNTHFVLCAGINGVVSIADSMTGNVIDFASKYGDPVKNILKFVVYKANPVMVGETVDQQPLIDQLRTDRDKNYNLFIAEQSVNAGLAKTNNELLTNVSEVKKENSDLLGKLQAVENKDAAAIDTASDNERKAINENTALLNEFHEMADFCHVAWQPADPTQSKEAILAEYAKQCQIAGQVPQLQRQLQDTQAKLDDLHKLPADIANSQTLTDVKTPLSTIPSLPIVNTTGHSIGFFSLLWEFLNRDLSRLFTPRQS